MIRYFQLENQQLKPVKPLNIENITWCDLFQPTENELMEITQLLHIPTDDLEDCLDETERPRYTFDNILNNHILIIRAMHAHAQKEDYSLTASIGIILTNEQKVITINNGLVLNYEKIFELMIRTKIQNSLCIMMELLNHFSVDLERTAQKLGVKARELQGAIIKSLKAEDIQRPFDVNSHLILFNTEILADLTVIKTFFRENKTLFDSNPQIFRLYDNVQIEYDQIYAFTSIYRDLLANSLDAYASVINNNVTAVMKVVGSIQLILSIPMLIASIYGMNVYMPGTIDQGPFTIFWILLTCSFLITFIVWRIIKHKNWL